MARTTQTPHSSKATGVRARKQAIEEFGAEARDDLVSLLSGAMAEVFPELVNISDEQAASQAEELEAAALPQPVADATERIRLGIAEGYFANEPGELLKRAMLTFAPFQISQVLCSQEPTRPGQGERYFAALNKTFTSLKQGHDALTKIAEAHGEVLGDSLDSALEKFREKLRAVAFDIDSEGTRETAALAERKRGWQIQAFRQHFVPMARALYATGNWTAPEIALLLVDSGNDWCLKPCPTAVAHWAKGIRDTQPLVAELYKEKLT